MLLAYQDYDTAAMFSYADPAANVTLGCREHDSLEQATPRPTCPHPTPHTPHQHSSCGTPLSLLPAQVDSTTFGKVSDYSCNLQYGGCWVGALWGTESMARIELAVFAMELRAVWS